MSGIPRLAARTLLTALGWAVGGFLIAWALLTFDALTGAGAMGVPVDPFALLTVVIGGVLFVILSGALLASGSRRAVSRRVMAVVGAAAMLAAVLVVELVLAGGMLGLFGEAPGTLLMALGVGAVLGWVSLAIGGVRE
ncbi:MAG TPA: hypothetical protein VJ925_11815 [Longimicrobiales bacterium]|nr:hypothetical protein [Longimicrobiales bacterium]